MSNFKVGDVVICADSKSPFCRLNKIKEIYLKKAVVVKIDKSAMSARYDNTLVVLTVRWIDTVSNFSILSASRFKLYSDYMTEEYLKAALEREENEH